MKKDTKHVIKSLGCKEDVAKISLDVVNFTSGHPTETEVVSRCMMVFEAILEKSLKMAGYDFEKYEVGAEDQK